jgi:Tol biopolymer transport system component
MSDRDESPVAVSSAAGSEIGPMERVTDEGTSGGAGQEAALVGRVLQQYRVVRRLGSGGMGEVYAAEDDRLHRRIALKILPPEVALDRDRLQRFQQEAQALAALNHPNVVVLYSVEEAEGIHFLTMELVEGKTLAEVIPAHGLPIGELLRLAIPLADALAAAHQHGVIHRDLKPANIMVSSDGRLKVLDFGLAKLRPSDAKPMSLATTLQLTGEHTIAGTASYMSPEQAEARPLDHRSDIFSLGVVLYEMTTGRRPFQGETAVSVISSILKDTPAPVSEARGGIPPELDRIVRRCLAKDPQRRYQTAADLRNDLEELLQQLGQPQLSSARWAARYVRVAAAVLAVGALAAAVYLLRARGPAGDASAAPRATFRQLTGLSGVEQFPSLSPDGKWVVYAGEAEGNQDIYLQSVGGQLPINLTADSPADDDEPAFSPDGERIVFRSSRDGGGLFVMGRTGEAARRVTRQGFNPAWSPDGARIAYSMENVQLTPLNHEGRSELWIADVESGAERLLEGADGVQPTWSPSGRRIAYVSRQSGTGRRQMDIWTIAVEGGSPSALTEDAAADWSPCWSPDGRNVYYASDRGGSMNLWRIAVDAASGRPEGAPEAITTPAPFLAHPSLSGTGAQIAYSSVLITQNVQKLAVEPATGTVSGEAVWLTSGSRQWSSPDVSPDGEWIVFYSRGQPEGDLYLVRADGTGLRQVTTDAAVDRMPRWSPNGAAIAFFSNRGGAFDIWKIRADGSELRRLTQGGGGVPVWSADGSRIATIRPLEEQTQAYLFDPSRSWQGQTPQPLAPLEAGQGYFVVNSWSPNGQRLAGMIEYSDKGILTYSLRTGAYERQTEFGQWPVWFGDSRQLLFVTKGRELHLFDTGTKRDRTIYSTTRDVIGPPSVPRDARAIYFSRRVTEADIWLVSLQ